MDEATGFADDDDDATIDVIIEGNSLSAAMARGEVLKIVGERTASASQKIRGIPAAFYPFIAGANNERIQALQEGKNVRIDVPDQHVPTARRALPVPGDLPITLSGDRLAVQEIRAEIERHAQELRAQLQREQLYINKGKHQFILGDRGIPAHQFLSETGCAVIFPNDPEDEYITIVGPADRIQVGSDRATDLASSMQCHNMDISRQYRNVPGGDATHARNVTRYLQRRAEIKRLEKLYNAHIVTPMPKEGSSPWELYSRNGADAVKAQSEIAKILQGHPPSRMANVPIDPFYHKHIREEVLPKVQQSYGVHTIVPEERDAESAILLVFEGPSGSEPAYQIPRGAPPPAEVEAFRSALEDARKYILSIIEAQEEIAKQTIDVPIE